MGNPPLLPHRFIGGDFLSFKYNINTAGLLIYYIDGKIIVALWSANSSGNSPIAQPWEVLSK